MEGKEGEGRWERGGREVGGTWEERVCVGVKRKGGEVGGRWEAGGTCACRCERGYTGVSMWCVKDGLSLSSGSVIR